MIYKLAFLIRTLCFNLTLGIDPEKDEFEFTLETPEDKLDLPKLKGEVVEKEETDT